MCIIHRNITESKSIELNYLYGKVNVVLCFDAGESIHRKKERPVLRFMKIMPYLMGKYYEFDESIACETLSFHYNAKGNISKANTLECHDQQGTKKLIFQLGSGASTN